MNWFFYRCQYHFSLLNSKIQKFPMVTEIFRAKFQICVECDIEIRTYYVSLFHTKYVKVQFFSTNIEYSKCLKISMTTILFFVYWHKSNFPTPNNRSEWHFRQWLFWSLNFHSHSVCNEISLKINCNHSVCLRSFSLSFFFSSFHLSIDVFDSPFQNRICFIVIPFNRIFNSLFEIMVLETV